MNKYLEKIDYKEYLSTSVKFQRFREARETKEKLVNTW